MILNDAIKHLQPSAELVAVRGHHKVFLGGINGITEIVRTGKSYS